MLSKFSLAVIFALAALCGSANAQTGTCASANYYNTQFHYGCLSAIDLNKSWSSPPVIGQVVPNSGRFADLTVLGGGSLAGTFSGSPIFSGAPSFTGTPTFAGMNITSGYQQNGVTIIQAYPSGTTNNANVLCGPGAGAALPAGATFNTLCGYGAGAIYAQSGAGETSAFGNGALGSLTAGVQNAAMGVYAYNHATTEYHASVFGSDVARNVFGLDGLSCFGFYSCANFYGGYGLTNGAATAFGARAMVGNAASLIFGGTPTAGDTIPIRFTSSCYGGGFTTLTYTVTGGDTTIPLLVASIETAILANAPIRACDVFTLRNANATPKALAILHAGTSTLGTAFTVTVGAITGAATETVTVTNGVVSTATNNVAMGPGAIQGIQLTSAYSNNAFGRNVLASLTTGGANTCMGDLSCVAMSTSVYNAVFGAGAGGAATTAYFNTLVGANAGAALTTANRSTVIGYNAGASTLATATNVLLLSTGYGTCDTNTDSTFLLCGNGTVFRIAAIGSASGSIGVFQGALSVGDASGTEPTLSQYGFGIQKTASGGAPTSGMVLYVKAGTNAGSCKLVAYAGSSNTPVTIVDNVGAGC